VQLADQIVTFRQFQQGLPLAGGAGLRGSGRQQPRDRWRHHVDDAQRECQQADRGDAEKAERLQAGVAQGIVDHQVGRRGDQGQQAAEQGGEGHRHHQPAGADAEPGGDAEHHRNEDRHHAGGTHERAQPGHRQHQQHQQPAFAGAGQPGQPDADLIGDAGPHQSLADHEQSGDQQDQWVAEAGHRFGHRQDPPGSAPG
jgi:hypothetical protein